MNDTPGTNDETKREQETDQIWAREEGKHRTWGHSSDISSTTTIKIRNTHTHTHTHTVNMLVFMVYRRNGFYSSCMCYCPTPTLHLNLALTGDGAFLLSLKKTHSVWFISVLHYGDTENVLINHLFLVIPMLYPCHYTNLCPHKPHKHAPTHTHTHTHTQRVRSYELATS